MAAQKKITTAAIEGLERPQLYSGSVYSAKLEGIPHLYSREYIAQPLATFTHPAAMNTTSVTALIAWGDGASEGYSTLENLRAVTETQMEVTCGQGIHSYRKPGIYDLKVTFSQNNKILATVRKAINVTQNSAGGRSVQMTTGTEAPVVLGTFTSKTAPPDDLVVSWGNGEVSAAVVTKLKNNTYKVTASHAYAKAGFYRIRVMTQVPQQLGDPVATDLLGATAVVHGATKTPAWLVATLTAPADTVLNPGLAALATVGGLVPGGFALAPTATIDWGSGSLDFGTIKVVDGHYVIFDHAPSLTTDYTATATIRLYANDQIDPTKGSLLATLTQQFTVKAMSPGARPIAVNGLGTSPAVFTGVLGVISGSPTQVPISLKLTWGDGGYAAVYSANGILFEPGDPATITSIGNDQYQISASHTYTDSGVYVVQGTIHYSDGTTDLFVDIATVLTNIY